MTTRSNFKGEARLAVEFTAQIPSGAMVSEAWPYPLGEFANGVIIPSGGLPVTGAHLGVQVQDWWYNWVWTRQWDSGYTDWLIQFPTGGQSHGMPPQWFGVVGSARLVYTDGSGNGLSGTANCAFTVKLKA